MNDLSKDIIYLINNYLDKFDLLLMSHVNRYMRIHALLHKKNSKWPIIHNEKKHDICIIAAFNGYTDVLLYFRKLNFVWNSKICQYAIMNAHFETLKWIKYYGCK